VKSALVVNALWELLLYDVMLRTGGFQRVHRALKQVRPRHRSRARHREADISGAMRSAMSLYWKPALCLQRSVATTRLFRKFGVPAELVIGYRADPFLSHAWVEIGGHVVNDSPAYQRRLQVLERL
jgi:hypothetical protein